MAMMPTTFDQKDGKGPSWLISDGVLCHFTAAQEFALVASHFSTFTVLVLMLVPLEDFALTEASYGIIRIIQTFPNLRLPSGYPQDPTGQEK